MTSDRGHDPAWASEAELTQRAKRGDPAALETIARLQLPRVERLLLRILGPRGDLEDLVQNVFLETCKALPGFRGDSALSTFIGGITVRVARRAMRPTAWARRRTVMTEEPPTEDPGPDRELVAQEQLRRVRSALERIAPKKRVAFMLWAFEGLTVQEIAETTGHSLSATRSQIYYAQKELRARARKDPYLVELLVTEVKE